MINKPYRSIYDRMLAANLTAKPYYYDAASSTMEVVNLLSNQPRVFGTYSKFLDDCKSGSLHDYSFASDHHPDHNIRAGEIFIASIYNAIFGNPDLWKSTLLLVVYDEHGGIYDHVPRRPASRTILRPPPPTPGSARPSPSTASASACPPF